MTRTMKATIISLSILLTLSTLTGCGAKSMSNDATATNPTVSGEAGSKPVIGAPQGTAPATLVTNDIIVGTGKEAVATSGHHNTVCDQKCRRICHENCGVEFSPDNRDRLLGCWINNGSGNCR